MIEINPKVGKNITVLLIGFIDEKAWKSEPGVHNCRVTVYLLIWKSRAFNL
jgi:hypothetical protein